MDLLKNELLDGSPDTTMAKNVKWSTVFLMSSVEINQRIIIIYLIYSLKMEIVIAEMNRVIAVGCVHQQRDPEMQSVLPSFGVKWYIIWLFLHCYART